MKQIVRIFSLGIMTSTFLLGFIYYATDEGKKIETVTEQLSEKEMISRLEASGYLVSKETSEADANAEDKSEEKQKESKETETVTESDKKTEPEQLTIAVDTGMSSSDIVEKLASAGIIEDSQAFTNFLNDQGYSTKIQLGEVTVEKGMTYKEIAETLTEK